MWTIPKDPIQCDKFSEDEIKDFIKVIAQEVVRRGMSVPAVMALELGKPLSFIGYSSLIVFGPILEVMIDPAKVEKLTCVFGDRLRIEELMVAIETFEKDGNKEGEQSGR